jgi:hypothetical protein
LLKLKNLSLSGTKAKGTVQDFGGAEFFWQQYDILPEQILGQSLSHSYLA